MVKSINEEDWNGMYYSVGLGKFFTVDVREDCVCLKNAFNSVVEREFDYDYFKYFVENSEFINIENCEKVYEQYSDVFKTNLSYINNKLLDLKTDIARKQNRCSEIKSDIERNKSQLECAIEQNKDELYDKIIEKRNELEYELKEMNDEIEKCQQKYQKLRDFRNEIKQLKS